MSYSNYYAEQRVRSFRTRKGISSENRFQAVIAALSITLLVTVGWQFLVGQHELTFERVQYTNLAEGN